MELFLLRLGLLSKQGGSTEGMREGWRWRGVALEAMLEHGEGGGAQFQAFYTILHCGRRFFLSLHERGRGLVFRDYDDEIDELMKAFF